MSLLHALQQLLGGNHQVAPVQPHSAPAQQQQMIPVGQPIPQQMMNSFSPHVRQLAQIYQRNPMDPRVSHIDPKIFGYAPDNTARPAAPTFTLPQVSGMQPQYGMASNFSTPIQGTQNPGLIPLQGSRANRYMPIQNGYNQNIQT